MRPKFSIIADQTDITALVQARLLALTINDEIGIVSDTATIELDDRDSAFEIPACGATLTISMGLDSDIYPLGQFVVDEVELKAPPQKLTITARAANSIMNDMGAFQSPQTKSWEKQTLPDMLQEIAGKYGLQSAVADTFAGIVVDHIDQTCESDCAFVQRIANEYGGAIKIAGGKLMLIDPYTGQFPDGTPVPTITVKEISNYTLRITERNKYGKVIAKYYDFDAAEEKEVSVGNESPVFTFRETFSTQAQAESKANAKMADIAVGTYELSIDMPGNAMLGAECLIEIRTGHEQIHGVWVVKTAQHTMSSSGFNTSITATRPRR